MIPKRMTNHDIVAVVIFHRILIVLLELGVLVETMVTRKQRAETTGHEEGRESVCCAHKEGVQPAQGASHLSGFTLVR